ncbi:MAG: sugar ABC transporter substrate-binding protein [Lachnospiraceae bacterium]
MKKTLRVALMIVAVLVLVTGCGKSKKNQVETTKDKNGQTKITYMETQPTEEKTALVNKMIDKFMKENPDIKVELISTPNDQASEKMFNLAAAGELPDIIEMNDSWLAPLAEAGHLEDLSSFIDEWEQKDNIVDAACQLGKVMDNKMYYIPYGLWGTTVFYNKEALEETGLKAPVSTEEFYNVAKAMTKQESGKSGYAMRGGLYGPTHAIMWMLGEAGTPNIIDEDTGECVFDTPEAIEGLKKYAELYQEGFAPADSISWGFRECVEAFTTEASGMVIQSNEVVQICNDKLGEDKYGTTMLPVGASGKTYDTSGQTGYAMSANSKNKEASWKFLSFMLDPEESRELVVNMGFTPINKELADDPAFTEGNGKVFMEQVMSDKIQFSNNPSYLPEWGELVGAYGTEQIQNLLLKKQTPEVTAKNLATFLNQAEEKYRKDN